MRAVLLAVTLALATAACAAPAASPSAAPASASLPPPAPSVAGSPAGTPPATDGPATEVPATAATSGPPIAVPDPLNPTTHQRGEEVQVGNATIVFRGVEDRDGSLYALFEIVSGSLPPARLLAVGATYALETGADASRLEAGPLGIDRDELDTDTELILNVGEQFVVFEAGEVLPAK